MTAMHNGIAYVSFDTVPAPEGRRDAHPGVCAVAGVPLWPGRSGDDRDRLFLRAGHRTMAGAFWHHELLLPEKA